MAFNLSDAVGEKQGGGFELIPDDSLAFANLIVRPKAPDMGIVAVKSKKDPDPGNPHTRYLDCVVELTSGPYVGRKIFHLIGTAGSDKWVMMSKAAMIAILEVGNNAGPHNPGGYVLGPNLADGDERAYMDLDGMLCAVRIGIEKGKDSYPDKNRVAKFLSPNPDSDGFKDFSALKDGAVMAEGVKSPAADKPAGGNAWSQPAGEQLTGGFGPTAVVAPAARPTWTGGAPPVATGTAPAADTTKATW